jgi:hypothetical protein
MRQTHLTVLREIMQSYATSGVSEVTSTEGFKMLTQILGIEYQAPSPAETKQTGWFSNIRWPRFPFGNSAQTQTAQPSTPPVTTTPNPNPALDS